MEAVGAVGAPEDARPPDLRDRATREAVMRATQRVAFPFLDPEALAREPVEPGELEAWLSALLGDDPLEYASRFRILEDRGVRTPLFGADHEMEYVVVVEAYVDVESVRERLASRGVLLVAAPDAPRRHVEILAELDSYAAYRGLVEALQALAGVDAVRPVTFERGHATLDIETHSGPDTLLLALLREQRAKLAVEALGVGAERLRLRVEWRAETEPPVPARTR